MQTATLTTTDPDQKKRIENLRTELSKLGAQLGAAQTESVPADMEEEFLRHVLEYERAEPVTLIRALEKEGLDMPPPDTLDDSRIDVKLGETISKMAGLGAYLLHTDHLTSRQLYEYLFNDGLREEAVLFPDNASYSYVIDLTGSGSDEDNQIYLKHYADEEHRQQWAHDWPTDPIPEHEDPPLDRDRYLPQAPIG